MSDKKRIDRIFQENFKDFEVSPDEKVWKNIEAELKKEKKRRIIPIPIFWYKAAGVAALVAISFLVGNIINNSPQTEVVNSNNVIEDPSKIQSAEKTFTEKNQLNTSSDQGLANSSEEKEGDISNQEFTPDKSSQQYSTTNTNSTLKANSSNVGKTAITYSSDPEDPRVKRQENSSADDISDKDDQKKKLKEKNPTVIAYQEKSTDTHQTEKENEKRLPFNSSETKIATENTAVLVSSKVIDKETSEESTEGLLAETLEPEEDKKKSLVEAAEEIKEEKEEDKDDHGGELSKWLIRPNVSPIYYGSLNGGNTIDPQFANNSAKGEVTMAYGLNFAYSVSEKFKIRSGVSKVNMSYNTNDIVFSSSVSAVALAGVDHHPQADNIEVQSRNSSTSETFGEVKGNLLSPESPGNLNQRFGFIEVPLEIEYALLETRFGINIIGGASTLFLDGNTVSINSAQGTTNLGEANNLNDVSFSTNVGLGFGYELTKKVDLNLEPTFKYQFNTFSNNTNGFKPYYFGVYTGFSFKF